MTNGSSKIQNPESKMMSMFDDLLNQYARTMAGNAAQAQQGSIFGQFAYWAQDQQAAQPQGRTVTPKLEEEMMIRRCGNICLEAQAKGWRARMEGGPRQFFVVFENQQRRVSGKPHTTKTGALVLAAEALESFGFLRD